MLQTNRPDLVSDMEIPLSADTRSRRYAYHTCSLPPRNVMREIPDYGRNRKFQPLKGWQRFMNALPALLILALSAFMLKGCSSPTAPSAMPILNAHFAEDMSATPTCVQRGAVKVMLAQLIVYAKSDFDGHVQIGGVYLNTRNFSTGMPSASVAAAYIAVAGTKLANASTEVMEAGPDLRFKGFFYNVASGGDNAYVVFEIWADIPANAPLDEVFQVGVAEKGNEDPIAAIYRGGKISVGVSESLWGWKYKVCS